jgi:hypothetical protein
MPRTTPTGCACLVPLVEIAQRAEWPFEAILSRNGITPMNDWAGRPAVPVAEAARLFAALVDERNAQHDEWQRHHEAQLAAEARARNESLPAYYEGKPANEAARRLDQAHRQRLNRSRGI